MPCANCGKTYEEHASGLAYRDFTGAGTECPRYAPQCPLCFDSGQVMRTDPADQKSVFYDKCPKCALARPVCRQCGSLTTFYERPDLCLKCETAARSIERNRKP